jgi:uncharacterized protein YcgI (DUF1989 family)
VTDTCEIHIPAASGRAFEARAGDYITVVDLEGQQIADFVALNAADHHESLSTCYTRSMLSRIYVREGDLLYTPHRRPILEIAEDAVGCHDTLFPACDGPYYEMRFGLAGHRNCLDNLSAALEPYGVERWQIPQPFNIFQNTRVDPQGQFVAQPALSRAGDRIVLRALMDLVGAVSACAQDQTPVNGYRPTPLVLRIGRQRP